MSEKICEICKNKIEENEETTSCPDCGREFHSKCWRITGKMCVEVDCREKSKVRKAAEEEKRRQQILSERMKESKTEIKKRSAKTVQKDSDTNQAEKESNINSAETQEELLGSEKINMINKRSEFIIILGKKIKKKTVFKSIVAIVTASFIFVVAFLLGSNNKSSTANEITDKQQITGYSSPTQQQTTVNLSTAQQNAVSAARQHIKDQGHEGFFDYFVYSKKGLKKKLESEGHSSADASFAVNYIDVDWFKQAEKSATAHNRTSVNNTKEKLIEQLQRDGFTYEEAVYGVDSLAVLY